MKVLIVDTFFSEFGGGQIIAYNTYKLLQEKGIETFYWALDKKPYFEEDYPYIEYFGEVYRGVINYLKNPFKYFYNNYNKKKLSDFIDLIKPDLIHIHSYGWCTCAIFDALKGIPTVLTVHDSVSICPAADDKYPKCRHLCKKTNYMNCILHKCISNNYEKSFRVAFNNHLLVSKFNKMDKLITPSEALKNALITAELGVKEENIEVVNNFLDKEKFSTKPNYTNDGYFLFVGRLSKEKGIEYLLKAMSQLDRNIKLHIIGKGEQENILKEFVNENNLVNVEFLGYKNGEDLKEEYQNCIASILPANWFEVFGMTNIEAFINGKPVIASNIGGIPEIVENNVNGFLVEPQNVEQLKESILKYWNDNNLAIEHGKNGYNKVLSQYSDKKYIEKLLSIYNDLIQN